MTVLDFLKSLRPLEDDPSKDIRLRVSRDGIQIAVEIIGHMRMDDLPDRSVRFLEKKKPEKIGPFHYREKERAVFVFDDDGSLDDERGFPINWREV